MTAVVVETTLGELLSPSQVNTFLSCPAKWYFRYALGLVELPTGALALGSAFHSVLASNFRQKIETKQDLPAQQLEEWFGEAFAMATEDAEFREDEEPAALIETGRALVRRYMDDAAPWIEPQAVELPVEGVIAGVRVQGIVDLLDMEGRNYRLQDRRAPSSRHHTGVPPAVDDVFDDHSGRRRLVQTGHRHEDQDGRTGAAELRNRARRTPYAETLYPMVQEAMRDGIYPPAPQQPGLFPPVLRVLARMRAGIRRTSRRVNVWASLRHRGGV
jgi:hypothetical protein